MLTVCAKAGTKQPSATPEARCIVLSSILMPPGSTGKYPHPHVKLHVWEYTQDMTKALEGGLFFNLSNFNASFHSSHCKAQICPAVLEFTFILQPPTACQLDSCLGHCWEVLALHFPLSEAPHCCSTSKNRGSLIIWPRVIS